MLSTSWSPFTKTLANPITPAQEAAQAHIETIEREYRLDGNAKLADLVRDALEILSTELYDSSTHFLLELLQNADDNTYADGTTIPSLSFTFSPEPAPGVLRVDCNEAGFTSANVDAICAIRKSTKKSRDASNGFTGEKGIGFKSVFKAAHKVWITSGAYQFAFDKRKQFGIVAPAWAHFPETRHPGKTSFLLELADPLIAKHLERALKNFDANLLLFLRRIRAVHLAINETDGTEWRRDLRRVDTTVKNTTMSILHGTQTDLRYLTWKYRVASMPVESKRPGCAYSDLTIAFPIVDSGVEQEVKPQSVYSGLPVAEHGLKARFTQMQSVEING